MSMVIELLTLQLLEHGYLHLEHLLLLLCGLELHGHMLARDQVERFVNFTETAATDALCDPPPFCRRMYDQLTVVWKRSLRTHP